MGKPKKVTAKISEKKMLNDKILFLRLENLEPAEVGFDAGQFISIEVGNGLYRSYSICNDPLENRFLELLVSIAYDGVGANFLKNISVGDTLSYIGPSGKFTLQKPLPSEIALLATGTGIAPFISYLHTLQDYKGHIRLYWGNRFARDLFFEDVLRGFVSSLSDFQFELYLSSGNVPNYKSGRITQAVSGIVNSKAAYYICGNPNMVEEVHQLLKENGVVESRIHYEKFITAKGKKPLIAQELF